MAYLDIDIAGTAAPRFAATATATATATPVADAAAAPGFARAEWQVIVLAQKDDLASLRAPTRLHRLVDRLFGGSFNPRLADPRLEALRRLAVFAWHQGYAVPRTAIAAFLSQGFSRDQLDLLLASVATGRARHGARRSATL